MGEEDLEKRLHVNELIWKEFLPRSFLQLSKWNKRKKKRIFHFEHKLSHKFYRLASRFHMRCDHSLFDELHLAMTTVLQNVFALVLRILAVFLTVGWLALPYLIHPEARQSDSLELG